MTRPILIVDDDKKIAHLIGIRLRKQGYSPHSVFDGKGAVEWVEQHEPMLVMLDVRLPDINGVEVLRQILKKRPKTYVIMISAHADIEIAVECIKLGACDFLEKPIEFPAFDAKVKQIFKQITLEEEVVALKKELGETYRHKSLIGNSMAMKKIFQSIEHAAKSNVTVLIEGESGTGKELVARAIHFNSPLREWPFIAINCGAIPENLMESELFGHEKGSFTGAIARKIGKFEQAHGGTIFLDEIGDLPLALQVKLLRVLQEKEIERVGGTQPLSIQLRVIAATHHDLKEMVKEGKFREDLYYRINVFPISIPPLRNRKEDISELYRHFINKHSKEKGHLKTDRYVLERLAEYQWPGNVRELENFVERLMLMIGGQKIITERDINALGSFDSKQPEETDLVPVSQGRVNTLQQTEKGILEKALVEAGGNIAKASKMVQMSRDTFYRKMKRYSIAKPS